MRVAIGAGDGVFTWTPTEAQGPGVYAFSVVVSDGHISTSQAITITVSEVNVAPVLFTWPSGGNLTDYVYDRDSALYSRDGLEAVLQALVNDPSVDSITILAHSMGNYLVMESLRQMSIRDRGLSPKIRDVMMAAPDIDIDVFRRQIAEIDAGPRPAYFTLFVSRDDRALGISSFLARDSTRENHQSATAQFQLIKFVRYDKHGGPRNGKAADSIDQREFRRYVDARGRVDKDK